MSYTHECQWWTTGSNHTMCDEIGIVQSLHLEDRQWSGILVLELGLLSRLTLSLSRPTGSGERSPRVLSQSSPQSNDRAPAHGTGIVDTYRYVDIRSVPCVWSFVCMGLEKECPTVLCVAISNPSNSRLGPWKQSIDRIYFGTLDRLSSLLLHNNSLTGLISEELGDLSSLTVSQLDANRLQGPLPADLGSISTLKELVLEGNDLSGNVPSDMCLGESLLTLNVDCDRVQCTCCETCNVTSVATTVSPTMEDTQLSLINCDRRIRCTGVITEGALYFDDSSSMVLAGTPWPLPDEEYVLMMLERGERRILQG